MKIKLKKAEHMDDWYTIVRAEHDGRSWWEPIGDFVGSRLMMSERLSPEACVEGSAEQMIEIAEAIKNRGRASFRRVAVRVEGEGAYFFSPRNSENETAVSLEEADELAKQILDELSTDPLLEVK